jgi:hypothetical protein
MPATPRRDIRNPVTRRLAPLKPFPGLGVVPRHPAHLKAPPVAGYTITRPSSWQQSSI